MHQFLVTEDGLSNYAKRIPEIREFIDELPDTAATFRPHQVNPDIKLNAPTKVFEFLGSWEVNEYYDSSRDRMFVNPSYNYARQYCDAVVECECGARIVGSYDDGNDRIQNEHNHRDDCLSYHRMAARAEIHRQRHEIIKHCTRLGWRGKDIAKRLGMTNNIVSSQCRDYGTTLTELRHNYRRDAAETYVYLVRKHGVPASKVTDIYCHTRSALGRWARKYLDYESENVNQFTRGDDGTFTWSAEPTVTE